ncbi:MAG: VRR-NUC domain-containing protein [Acidobacteriota bacterium]
MTEATEPTERREPPEGYYVDNFRAVLDTVATLDGPLLSGAEVAWRARFGQMSRDAQRLYVRLVSRKGPLFRRERLVYPEIADLDAAARELERFELLDRGRDASLAERLALLRRPELAALLHEVAGTEGGGSRRAELIARLFEQVPLETLAAALDRRLEVLRPLGRDHVRVFRLLFFGNLDQDWTELLLADLGVVRYESYPLRPDRRLFSSRRAVDATLAAREMRAELRVLLAHDETEAALALGRSSLDRLTGGEVEPLARPHLDRVVTKVGRLLERLDRPREALEHYRAAEAPPARERSARVLEHLGEVEAAFEVVEAMEQTPRDEAEVVAARRLRRRLTKARGDEPPPRRRRRLAHVLELTPDPDLCVERRVLAHYEALGKIGVWSENWLWRALFGLTFWDIVFAPVQGAFQHPFQVAPLDLDGPGFQAARGEQIETRLAELRGEDDLRPRVRATLEAKRGVANPFVAWHSELDAALDLALGAGDGDAGPLRGRHLALVAKRLARDPGRYRRGLPDLFLVDSEEPEGFRLLEVKGPGDQLRPEQTGWLDHFEDHGFPASVLKVVWSPVSASRQDAASAGADPDRSTIAES